ncbi:MAG: hypothetical protein ACW99G_03605 [Candidatus Thorarchaeota archaeon]|jgi:hypothetical protein
MVNETVIKDALYNLADKAGSKHGYARGVLVGVIATLIANGQDFEEAVTTVKQYIPKDIDPKRIPEGWEENFKDFTKPPMCKITGSEVEFSLEVPESEIVAKAKHIFENPLEYSDYNGEAAYYHFLKFLWIEYPNGDEKRLADICS